MVAQCLDHLAVHEIEQRRPLIDDRDLDVQGREHRRVFESNDAGTHDDQLTGQLGHIRQLIRVEDELPVEGNVGRAS